MGWLADTLVRRISALAIHRTGTQPRLRLQRQPPLRNSHLIPLAPVRHTHSTLVQAKVLLEAFLERIGKPIEFWRGRQGLAYPQDSPPTASPTSQPGGGADLADAEIKLGFVSRGGP